MELFVFGIKLELFLWVKIRKMIFYYIITIFRIMYTSVSMHSHSSVVVIKRGQETFKNYLSLSRIFVSLENYSNTL